MKHVMPKSIRSINKEFCSSLDESLDKAMSIHTTDVRKMFNRYALRRSITLGLQRLTHSLTNKSAHIAPLQLSYDSPLLILDP